MKVAVVAANGRSGLLCVAALLDAGMNVRAGVYGTHNFVASKHLAVFDCDATNSDDVAALVEGSDAVVSLIGHTSDSPSRVQTMAMTNVLAAMRRHEITRLISLTGTGVRFDADRPSLIDKLANRAIALVDPERIRDGIEHAELLKSSQLDWTLLRVLKLTNGKHSGIVDFNLVGPAELFTPRRRVAAAVVQLLQDNSYIRQAPIITGGSVNAGQ